MTPGEGGFGVVIGVGNEFRHDDGVGLAVAERVRGQAPPGVLVVMTDGEPTRMLDAWVGSTVAVVVDAVLLREPTAGRVHRMAVDGVPGARPATSSHGLGLPDAVELGRALDRMPGRLVLYTVEVADTGYGVGLSGPVAAAVPELVAAVLRELYPQG